MFDFINKMQFHQEKINSLLEDRIENSLSTVFIDLVSGICNHKCIFCDGKFNPIKKAFFSKSKLCEISKDLGGLGVNSVIIVGEGGESLLNPNFEFFSKQLLARKIHVGLYTNGSMLNKENLKVISKFDFVRISLDSGSLKTHQQVHGYKNRDDFSQIFKSIKYLRNKSRMQIGASFILLSQNIDELSIAAKKLKKSGANYIEIKPAYLKNYNFNSKAFKLISASFKKQLVESYILEDDNFKIFVNNQLKEIISNKNMKQGEITKLKKGRKCLTCRLRLVVSPTGCYICPPNRSKKDFCVGDVQKKSLKAIWNCHSHLDKIRKKCNFKCPYHKQNEALTKLKDNHLLFDNNHCLSESNLISQKYFL